MICQNPDCKKNYSVEDTDADPEFCSFSCWEKTNCKKPLVVNFEQLVFD